MSPRPYNLGKRQDPVDQGRQQVVDAARLLLGGTAGYAAFTVDAVAKQADVARATVYYQFGSKAGLLEAVCDYLAGHGGLSDLDGAFTDPDPREALDKFVSCFGRFWDADRPVMRRLRALAVLDPEVSQVISARDQRRADGLAVLVGRLAEASLTLVDQALAVRVLMALTSFETFDTIAGSGQDLTTVAPDIFRLIEQVLGL